MLSTNCNQTLILISTVNPPSTAFQHQPNYHQQHDIHYVTAQLSKRQVTTDFVKNTGVFGDGHHPKMKSNQRTRSPTSFPSSSHSPIKCITDLDDYSMLSIFSYVSNIREKIRLKRVCHRFYRLSTESLRSHHQSVCKRENIYYSREIRPFSRVEKRVRLPLDKLLISCPNLVEFKSTVCYRICYNAKKLPFELVNLEKLTLHGWSNVKMSSSLVRRCTNLKYLDLGFIKTNRNFADYYTDLGMIESDQLSILRLHGVHYSSDNVHSFMYEKGCNLKSFHYSSSLIPSTVTVPYSSTMAIMPNTESQLLTSLIENVFNYCPNLNHFELRIVDYNGFVSSTLNLTPLKQLSSMTIVTERRSLNVENLEVILKHCPSLEYLLIVSNFLNTDVISLLCKRYCPLIKKYTHRLFGWHEMETN